MPFRTAQSTMIFSSLSLNVFEVEAVVDLPVKAVDLAERVERIKQFSQASHAR